MWSTPAVWKQYNKMVVFHFFPINSPLKYILFSLASNLPQTNLMHKICHKIYEWALNLPKHNLNSWSLPQKLWMSFKSATNNLNAWNRPQILRGMCVYSATFWNLPVLLLSWPATKNNYLYLVKMRSCRGKLWRQ